MICLRRTPDQTMKPSAGRVTRSTVKGVARRILAIGVGSCLAAALVVACGAADDTDKTPQSCTIGMCNLNDAGTRACCPGKGVCCDMPVPDTVACGYDPATGRYVTFCTYCLPDGWTRLPMGAGAGKCQ